MTDTLICPACGEINPPDLEFCQNCQARLHPLTGPLKGENAPLQPGQPPVKKATAELEPILPQWLREARQKARQAAEEETDRQEEKTPSAPQEPDLLAGLASQSQDEEEIPDWLASITGAPPQQKKAEDTQMRRVELRIEAPPPSQEEEPGTQSAFPWLEHEPAPEKDELTAGLMETPSPTEPARPPQPPHEMLDWLRSLDATAQETSSSEKPPFTGEFPRWAENLQAAAPAEATPEQGQPAQEARRPSAMPFDEGHAEETGAAELPDWLKSLQASQEAPSPPAAAREEALPPAESPDWLKSLRAAPLTPQQGASPARSQESPPEAGAPPPFTEEALADVDVDALSSIELPDWLSSAVAPSQPAAEEQEPPAAKEEALVPAELPAWVQAMRPVEATLPEVAPGGPEPHIETLGPLAGLQGVLPAVPTVKPTSKPGPPSLKLEATEEQQAQAALLEQLLASESVPLPLRTEALVTSQRLLRWMITGLLFLVVSGMLLAGARIFPLPSGVPLETLAAIQAVETIPADAPVLVVFDYEPATVGEMEAAGAPLLDHLLLLRHPRLTLLSTSPTGAALAERFLSTILRERAYQRGLQYINLGYLPGGQAGVYDFAQNPPAAMPFSLDGAPAWQTAPLQGVTRLADFAALIVLTDSLEAGRVWIEQAAPFRGRAALVMISSAQAGPMFLPYGQSAQINGLVNGLNGAVGVEQANGGRPGLVRRYWDAYSLTLWLAVGMMLLGGLWGMASGKRARRTQETA